MKVRNTNLESGSTWKHFRALVCIAATIGVAAMIWISTGDAQEPSTPQPDDPIADFQRTSPPQPDDEPESQPLNPQPDDELANRPQPDDGPQPDDESANDAPRLALNPQEAGRPTIEEALLQLDADHDGSLNAAESKIAIGSLLEQIRTLQHEVSMLKAQQQQFQVQLKQLQIGEQQPSRQAFKKPVLPETDDGGVYAGKYYPPGGNQ